MGFLDSLDAEVAHAADARHHEVVVGVLKDCLKGNARDVARDMMRRLSPTCNYRKISRKLRKWSRRKESIIDRYNDDFFVQPSRALSSCDASIRYYNQRLNSLSPCRHCLSCALERYDNTAHHLKAVREEAASVADELKSLIQPIFS